MTFGFVSLATLLRFAPLALIPFIALGLSINGKARSSEQTIDIPFATNFITIINPACSVSGPTTL
jgi:hypothetical protein